MAEPIKGKLVTIKNLETGEVTDLSGAWAEFDDAENGYRKLPEVCGLPFLHEGEHGAWKALL